MAAGRGSRQRRGAVLVTVLLLTGCSGSDEGAPGPTDDTPEVVLSLTQLLPDEGSERALLRVVNTSDDDLHVTRIGLDWPGFGEEFRQDKDVTILPAHTMDLRMTLPPPECADVTAPVVGIVESGEESVSQELKPTGQVYVRRLWSLQCSRQFVEDRLGIEYGEQWWRRGSGAESSVVGTLELTRRSGDEPVRRLGVQGSVLYELALPGRRTLRSGQPAASIPLEILPGNRCDEHARGQATAPFTFRLDLRIGDAEPSSVLIEPPLRGQREATAMLDRACDAGAGGEAP